MQVKYVSGNIFHKQTHPLSSTIWIKMEVKVWMTTSTLVKISEFCEGIVWINANVRSGGIHKSAISQEMLQISISKITTTCLKIMHLTHCGLVIHITSCNGLLPDGTKPLHEPMLTSQQWGPVAFTWDNFTSSAQATGLDKELENYAFKKLLPHFPGANGLRRQTTMLVSCSQCFWKGCICFISVYFHFFFSPQV